MVKMKDCGVPSAIRMESELVLVTDVGLQEEAPLLQSFSTFGLGPDFGNLGGCQSEFVRVPFADKSLFVIENDKIGDNEFLFLTDIFATAWTCLDFAGFQPGVAFLRGASRVFSVDHVPARLEKAKSIGAIPINLAHGKPSDQILKISPNGTDRACDCIGYECLNEKLKPEEGFVINQAVEIVSSGGGIGVIGVYFAEPSSKGTPRGATLSPSISFPISTFWAKNLTMKAGGVDSKVLTPTLLELINAGRAKPSFIISAELQGLDRAPEAYRLFDQKLETKIVFKFPFTKEDTSVASSDQAIGKVNGDHGEDHEIEAHEEVLDHEIGSLKRKLEDHGHENEHKSFEDFAREIRSKVRRRN